MNDTLNQLYNRFYTPLSMEESEQEIETCRRQLIERLEKPERKLVLRIMDAQNLITLKRSGIHHRQKKVRRMPDSHVAKIAVWPWRNQSRAEAKKPMLNAHHSLT